MDQSLAELLRHVSQFMAFQFPANVIAFHQLEKQIIPTALTARHKLFNSSGFCRVSVCIVDFCPDSDRRSCSLIKSMNRLGR